MSLPVTPSQTVGPYFAIALPWPDGQFSTAEGTPGAIWIRGRVLDGAGDPVPDALVETWQADPNGRFEHALGRHPRLTGFRGFGRCPTDAEGRYAILTLKPGSIEDPPGGGSQAPHVDVSVFARGLLTRVVTRCYFGDEPDANAADPVLATVDPAARATLVAEPVEAGYRFYIRLQGDRETVFFEL